MKSNKWNEQKLTRKRAALEIARQRYEVARIETELLAVKLKNLETQVNLLEQEKHQYLQRTKPEPDIVVPCLPNQTIQDTHLIEMIRKLNRENS